MTVRTGANFRKLHGNLSAFTHAAEIGDTRTVRHLLETKINPSIKDSTGDTALHCAAFCGRSEVIEILLNAKAEPDTKDPDDQTAIDIAVQSKRHNWIKCAELLIGGRREPQYERILAEAHRDNNNNEKDRGRHEIEKTELLNIIHNDLTDDELSTSNKTKKILFYKKTVHVQKKKTFPNKRRKSITHKFRRRGLERRSLDAHASGGQQKKKVATPAADHASYDQKKKKTANSAADQPAQVSDSQVES